MYKNLKSKIKSRQFAVIRRRYSLQEVPWQRIHNAIAKAMSICVAFGNKVMNTRLPLPAGSGDKYNVESSMQWGRSMIEMLGVLAIIGVLSVGGIAGYSKAMEQFRINKAIAEYSFLIQGLLEHIDVIKRMSDKNYHGQNGLVDFVQAAHLVPETWVKNRDDVNFQMKDTYGNIVQIFSRRQRLVIDLYLGGFTKVGENKAASLSFSPKFCASIMQNVVQPLSSVLNYTYITYNYKTFYGNETCYANRKCIRDLTLSEINSICHACTGQANNYCGIALEFN